MNEHTRIHLISIGMLLAAMVPYLLGITHINTNLYLLLNDPGSSKLYTNLGFSMFGCLLPYFASGRGWKEYAVVIGVGSLFAVCLWFLHPAAWTISLWSVTSVMMASLGFGLVSVAMIFFNKSSDPDKERTRQKLIDFYIFVNALQFSAYTLLSLTVALHPATFDAVAYHLDAAFGFYPSVFIAQIYSTCHWFAVVLNVGYEWGLWGVALLYACQLRLSRPPPANLLMVWAISVPCALIAYHFCPIAGPGFFFGKDHFPNAMPALNQISEAAALAIPSYRNGFPSMHGGTCLILLFTARYQKSFFLKLFLYALTASVFLATLGLGEHYLIDLVGSFPFIVAIQSFCTRVNQAGQRYRIQATLTGVALWLIWVLLIRNGLGLVQFIPGLIWLVSLLTIAASLFVYSRLWPYEVWGSADSDHVAPVQARKSGRTELLMMLFVLGFTGLITEFILYKRIAPMIGDLSGVKNTVQCVYLAGLAAGCWLGQMLINRRAWKPLKFLGVSQFLVGVFCLLSSVFIPPLQSLYSELAQGTSAPFLATGSGIFFGGVVLFVPAILMGISLASLLNQFALASSQNKNTFAYCYGTILAGAALAALLLGYTFLPLLGMTTCLCLSAVGSLAVALTAFQLNKNLALPVSSNQSAAQTMQKSDMVPGKSAVDLTLLILIGCVLALVLSSYTQLLTVVAGSSSYVAALILFMALTGLATGALLSNVWRVLNFPIEFIVSFVFFGLACVLLGGVFQWDSVPAKFASFSAFTYPVNFYGQEAVRACSIGALSVPPMLLIGACISLLVELRTARDRQNQTTQNQCYSVGLQILGMIIAVAAGGILLNPAVEPHKIIQFAAALCVLAGLVIAISRHFLKSPWVLGSLIAVLALFAWQPATFDFTNLSSGSHVYFNEPGYGSVIDHAMNPDTGLTVVAVTRRANQINVKTLLTNGQFSGDDSADVKVQLKFAVTPLLYSTGRENALVLGYGTGFYANVVRQAGFQHIDIVEHNQNLMTLSNTYFANLNGLVSEQKSVAKFSNDGRSFLVLTNKKYDLIAVNVVAPWIANNAAFYNREFYQLVARRLSDSGVFEQGMQLSHLTRGNLACILSTVRSVFSNVALFVDGDHARIIASKKTLDRPVQDAVDLIQTESGLLSLLNLAGLSSSDIGADLVLSPHHVNVLVDAFKNSRDFVISTDDNAYLEYALPKENSLDSIDSMNQLHQFLMQWKSR